MRNKVTQKMLDKQFRNNSFIALNVISEMLGYLRFMFIDYFGIISVFKCLVDCPKEVLRTYITMGI